MAKKNWFQRNIADFSGEPDVTEEETNVEDTSEEITVSNTGDIAETNTEVSISVPSTGDGVFDQKFYDFLQGVIAENNIPGIDWFEYREALKKMTGLPEATAFQMAFDNFKIVDPNLSKETLLASIDHYDGLMDQEEKDFEAEMAAETEREVTARRQQATQLQEDNKSILEQINQLQAQISTNQEKAIELNNEAAMAEVNISQTGKNFTKTITDVRTKLSTDKTKIGELVKETKTA